MDFFVSKFELLSKKWMNWTETVHVIYLFNKLPTEMKTVNFLEDLDIWLGHLWQQVQNPCLAYFEPYTKSFWKYAVANW